jgi:hypothetical protein
LEQRRVLFERPTEADQVGPDLTLDHLLDRRAEISRLLSQISETIDTIKRQLESPRPENSDPDWASRAAAALKRYKRKLLEHERAFSNLTAAARAVEREGEARKFVRAAKAMLPHEMYAAVWAEVHADA